MTETPQKGFIISNKLYDSMKRLVTVILPAFSTLYFILGSVFGLNDIAITLGIMVGVTTVLGVVLQVSTRAYSRSDARFDGSVDIYTTDTDVKVYSLNLNSDPEDLDENQIISFKVNRN